MCNKNNVKKVDKVEQYARTTNKGVKNSIFHTTPEHSENLFLL